MTVNTAQMKSEWTSSVNSQNKYYLERFFSEIEFAQKLAGVYPDQAHSWTALIEDAVRQVEAVISAGRQEKIFRDH